MTHGFLRPVGERVPIWPDRQADGPALHGTLHLLDSGTSALGVAIAAAVARRGHPAPEVLLPAYGCPDLVAATLWAGARPVLVDIETDYPRMPIERVGEAISGATAAVVAPAFLGVREDLLPLRALCELRGPMLIDDSAQWFPQGAFTPTADYTVFSFGRGKPLSLFGGGALLCTSELPAPVADRIAAPRRGTSAAAALAAPLYDLLLARSVYRWVAHTGLGGVGTTHFHPLEQPRRIDGWRRRLLAAQFERHRRRDHRVLEWARGCVEGGQGGGVRLPAVLRDANGPLLRLPVLLGDRERRDAALSELRARGFGATAMYSRGIADMDDVPCALQPPVRFPNARAFADRLLTLPAHGDVDREDVIAMFAALEYAAGNQRA